MPVVSVRVHVLAADPVLRPHREALAEAAETAIICIAHHLPLEDIDVVVAHNPFAVIPELGIGGFCPSAHLVQVAVDPAHADFEAVIDTHLSRTLAHELHHCARWRGPGYGRSLGHALVSEGLADHFDLEVHAGARPYHWARALSEPQLQEVWELAQLALWDTDYDHSYWFFNSSDAGPPYHAGGYSLGFHLVAAYLAANPDLRPSQLAAVPARQVLESLSAHTMNYAK